MPPSAGWSAEVFTVPTAFAGCTVLVALLLAAFTTVGEPAITRAEAGATTAP